MARIAITATLALGASLAAAEARDVDHPTTLHTGQSSAISTVTEACSETTTLSRTSSFPSKATETSSFSDFVGVTVATTEASGTGGPATDSCNNTRTTSNQQPLSHSRSRNSTTQGLPPPYENATTVVVSVEPSTTLSRGGAPSLGVTTIDSDIIEILTTDAEGQVVTVALIPATSTVSGVVVVVTSSSCDLIQVVTETESAESVTGAITMVVTTTDLAGQTVVETFAETETGRWSPFTSSPVASESASGSSPHPVTTTDAAAGSTVMETLPFPTGSANSIGSQVTTGVGASSSISMNSTLTWMTSTGSAGRTYTTETQVSATDSSVLTSVGGGAAATNMTSDAGSAGGPSSLRITATGDNTSSSTTGGNVVIVTSTTTIPYRPKTTMIPGSGGVVNHAGTGLGLVGLLAAVLF